MVKAKKTIALFVSFLCLSIMGCSGDSSSEGPKYETLAYEDMTFDYYTEREGYVVSDYRGQEASISACPLLESASYSYVDQAMSSYSLSNSPSLKTFVVPSGVNAISQAAFDELPALEKVFIPSSVGVIANHAFYQCNPKLTIYCTASSTPSAFEDGWNEDAWDGAWREHTVVFNASKSDVEG